MSTQRTVAITGSTSGIGLGIAERFAAAGYNIGLNGLGDPAEIKKIGDRIEKDHGVQVFYHGADMTDPAQIRDLIAKTEQQLGPIDVLVNNAGIQHVSEIENFPDEKWDAILGINLSSAFHTIKAVVPSMKARGFGRIINIASAHALVASPFKSAYVAAKHGVLGLTKTVALEVAQHGITVNAICPGYVKTPLVEKQIPDTAQARGITEEEVIRDVLLAAQPTKQFVGVDQIASLALHLCKEESSSITGAALQIDGGWVAQ